LPPKLSQHTFLEDATVIPSKTRNLFFYCTTMIDYFKTCESYNSYLKLCNNFEPSILNFVSSKHRRKRSKETITLIEGETMI